MMEQRQKQKNRGVNFTDEDRAKSRETMQRHVQERKNKFLEAFLSTSYGHIGIACVEAGISRQTYNKWMLADKAFAEAIHDAQEYFTDDVEQKLVDKIEEGDFRAIALYLKTKGKDRGWVERTEQVVSSDEFEIDLKI